MGKFLKFCCLKIFATACLEAQNPVSELPTSPLLASDASALKSALDIEKIFVGAPIIYSLLALLSVGALSIWIYTLITWRRQLTMPQQFIDSVSECLKSGDFEGAKQQCQSSNSAIATILNCGLNTKNHGSKAVFKAIESEGRRLGMRLWQKISLLNDIAVTAPMMGLLGTVLGIFYGFYDKKRAYENLLTVFDGLGIAIGTTVVGLLVAILAMILHATLKIWAAGLLSDLEMRAMRLASAICHESSSDQSSPNSRG